MISNGHPKSQLEFFLNPNLAGNTPQNSVSTSLLNVLISFSKLSDAIFMVTKSLSNNAEGAWIDISRKSSVMEEKLKVDFGMKDAFELTALLNEIGKHCSALSGDIVPVPVRRNLFVSFRQILANLILYAKEFGDVSFKSDVLNLVKRWEAVK